MKAAGKLPNLLLCLIKIKSHTECQTKLGSAVSQPELPAQNPAAKSRVDGWGANSRMEIILHFLR